MDLLGSDTVMKEIGGKQYTLKLLSASDAIEAASELTQLMAMPIGSAFDSGAFDGLDNISDMNFGKNIAMTLVSALGKKSVVPLLKTLTANMRENDVPMNFDTYFRGKNLGKLPVFLAWSIEENGISPNVFIQGFSEMAGVDISQTLSMMSQTKAQEDTEKKLED